MRIKNKDYLTLITIILMVVTSIAGILSINFSRSYDIMNQYGHTVKLYGYGIYAYDTYLQASTSIGTDICALFVVVPLFIYSYINYTKKDDLISELKLIAIYAVVFYYSASIAFGLTYNRLFLVYVALFGCSLFGMFKHICRINLNKSAISTKGLRMFLIISGIALMVAWLPDVIPTVLNGKTLNLIGVYTTNITYVLDMGIISPICFLTLYLLRKQNPIGTLLLAILIKLCIIVGIMMLPQTICQIVAGCDLPLPVLITKSFSFIALGGFAFYFDKKLYIELKTITE